MIEILSRDKQILLWSSEEFDVILMQDENLGETLPCHRSHVSSIAEGLWILSPRIELTISLFAQAYSQGKLSLSEASPQSSSKLPDPSLLTLFLSLTN